METKNIISPKYCFMWVLGKKKEEFLESEVILGVSNFEDENLNRM